MASSNAASASRTRRSPSAWSCSASSSRYWAFCPGGVQHSLPGGLVENGEDQLAALRRELLKELRLVLDDLPGHRLRAPG
ncbi:NUDIX domain-containing protein [Kitasatospora sp. NPDC091207]|uniref:NUDIX domain-containing protein n=1 Tax=Kitasatospora sp. NPDC091207 TaxID=3364083 RepID=UPI003816B48F